MYEKNRFSQPGKRFWSALQEVRMHHASRWIPPIVRKICSSDKGMVNKRSWTPQNRFVSVSFILMIVMAVIFRFSFWSMTLLFPDSNRILSLRGSFLPLETDCCKGHIFLFVLSWRLKMSDSNRSSALRTQHAALTPHSQVTDGIWTRIWRYHKPLHSQFCHSHSISGTTRTRIRWLEATQSCPINLRR